MEMEVLFTVVIPAYNIASYIRPCVDSVLASMKDCRDTQILIVDDGSTDGTAQAADECRSKDERIKVIHQANQGASAARNAAIKNAQGKYCIFVDGDDEMLPNAIDSIRKCVETAPDAVVSRFKTIDGEGNIEERMQYNFELLSALPPHRLYDKIGCPNAPWVFCVKTQFMIDNGLFYENGLVSSNDDEWAPRMFFAAKSIVLNNEYCYLYRIVRPGSLTTENRCIRELQIVRIPDLYWKKFHEGAQKGIYSGEVLEEALRYTRRYYTVRAMRSVNFREDVHYNQLLCAIRDSAYILENSPSGKERVLFSLMRILGTKHGIDAFRVLVSFCKSRVVKAARKAVTFPFRAVRKVYRVFLRNR